MGELYSRRTTGGLRLAFVKVLGLSRHLIGLELLVLHVYTTVEKPNLLAQRSGVSKALWT